MNLKSHLSCDEFEDFADFHHSICKLRVILRSRVLRVVDDIYTLVLPLADITKVKRRVVWKTVKFTLSLLHKYCNAYTMNYEAIDQK